MNAHRSDGFSAVELLITLFIAAVFLIAGYQLAVYVGRSGAEAEQIGKASNIAHAYLREYTNTARTSTGCKPPSTGNILYDGDVPTARANGLPGAYAYITCAPAGNPNPTSLVSLRSTIWYGSGGEVTHAIFVE